MLNKTMILKVFKKLITFLGQIFLDLDNVFHHDEAPKCSNSKCYLEELVYLYNDILFYKFGLHNINSVKKIKLKFNIEQTCS